MPYIERDDDNKIVAIHKNPSDEASELMDETTFELLDFLLPSEWPLQDNKEVLSSTDLSMVRVVEDLITVLISKNVLTITDLPEAAVRKILLRQQLRDKLDDIGSILN